MIAVLPMYDLPWLRAANDRFWQAVAAQLRARGIDAPLGLSRGIDADEAWRSPGLLLGQTCGYPLLTELRETVQLIATPVYAAEGCEGASHRSAIVVRADAPGAGLVAYRGMRVGVNGPRSNTGMNLLRGAVAPFANGGRFFGEIVSTGSHARSLAALLSGRIDLAAIDAVTFAHLRTRYPHHAALLRVLQWTDATPGLPLIAAADVDTAIVAGLRDALDAVTADPALAEARATLRIAGFARLDLADYAPVLAIEEAARRLDYPILQ